MCGCRRVVVVIVTSAIAVVTKNPVNRCAVKAGSATAPPNQSSSCHKFIYAKKTIT